MKPSLLIISDMIRSDLHSPLRYFRKFAVTHAYRQASYGDMTHSDWAATPYIRFRNPLQLMKLVTALRPDIVQLPEPTAGRRAALTTALILPAAKQLGAKIIVPFFENVPLEQKFKPLPLKLITFVTKRLINEADLLIYLNQGAKDNLLKLGAPEKTLKQLFWGSWGTDERFRPNAKVKSQNAKLRIVLYVGVVSKRKGIRYLVEAMEQVIKKVPRAKLWLVGPPGDFEPPQKSWIQYLGAKKNRDLPRLFQKASVSVLASIDTPEWQEQVGMVNLQSLACGTPVITTRSGAIPEFVKDGEGAIFVRQKDAGALAQSIVKILNLSPEKYAALSRKGRAWVRERYEIRPNIKKIERLLNRL